MALDGIFLHFLCEEINKTLAGAKVDKIHQPTKNELVFIMRTRTSMYKLFFTADANAPRFHLTEKAPENPQNPPMLCMLFRKRLTGATLLSVTQSELDRVAFFDFDATNEIGDKVRLTLAVEIMAQHSNVILFDENKRIADALKRVNSEKSSYRLVLPGAEYKMPPAQYKIDIREKSAQTVAEAVTLSTNKSLSSAILSSVQGVSPLLSRELSYRACFEDKAVSELSSLEKERLVTLLDELKTTVSDNKPHFCLCYDESEKPYDFSFMPITQYGNAITKKEYGSPSALLDAFYSERETVQRTRSRATELFKQLETVIDRTSRKLNNQHEDLKKCDDRDELRIKAELITANQYSLQKGASQYDVPNYYDDNNILTIAVDPALSPSKNAQKFYKEYRKACTAEQMLKTLIEQSESDLQYLTSVRDLLSRSTMEREFNEIKDELITQGFLRNKRGGKKVVKKAALPPLEFITSQGLKVFVGRNNTQNDKLTFKMGKKGDIWLHAQKAPGSHVLLVSDGDEVPDDAIVEAAEIAAFYSSVSSSTLVTVDYSDVKNIKKPNGAKPGFVIYYTYYSVNVKPKNPEK